MLQREVNQERGVEQARVGGWGGLGALGGKMFRDGFRLRLIRKVTSEQSSGGVGGVAHAALQGKDAPARGENKPESLS